MRKLEARLEKVADEKWNEDAATEDEEAAAGLSMYTPSLVTALPCSTFSCWGNPSGSCLCLLCFAFFLPRPWLLSNLIVYLILRSRADPTLLTMHPSFSSACSLPYRLPSGSDRLRG